MSMQMDPADLLIRKELVSGAARRLEVEQTMAHASTCTKHTLLWVHLAAR